MSNMTYLDKILRLFTSEFTYNLNTSCAVSDHQKVYICYENLLGITNVQHVLP